MGGLLNTLMVPIMFLNLFGGIIAGIWLAVVGKWHALGIGIIISLISSFAINIAMLPSVLISIPAFKLFEKRNMLLGHFFILLSNIYIFALLWYWVLFIFGLFASYVGINGAGRIPLLLWAYSVAIAPIAYMASKEDKNDPSSASIITAISFMVGTAIFMALLMFGLNPGIAHLTFIVILMIGLFAQLVISVQISTTMIISKDFENH